MIGRLLIFLALILPTTAAYSQQRDTTITVSLLTCAPGDDIYELEGHSALRIQTGGSDMAVNWGLFDFDSPGFVYRFVKGETDYCVGAYPTELFLYQYRMEGRRVVEQVLNLDRRQAQRLVDLVVENLKPENKVYRYNYVKDNCSTRVLKMIEAATGDSVAFSPAATAEAEGTTFRSLMAMYHSHYPWYQFGIDLALGSGIDRPIGARESVFAPVALSMLAADATLVGADGQKSRLVARTEVLVDGNADGTALAPTPVWLTPMFWGWVVLIAIAAVSVRDIRRQRATRTVDSIYYGVLFLNSLVLTFLIFVSVHEATSPNWIYLWINPLCIVGAAGVWLKKWKNAVYWWQIINFVALLSLITIGFSGIQTLNRAFYPLIAADMFRALTYIYLHKCRLTTT